MQGFLILVVSSLRFLRCLLLIHLTEDNKGNEETERKTFYQVNTWYILPPMDDPAATTGERILKILKTKGPQSAIAVGLALEITDEAARQQLLRLRDEGFVEAFSEIRGLGRPKQMWKLTASASIEKFPDAHAQLTVQLISTIRNVLGEEALEQLISTRESETRAGYERELKGAHSLQERLTRLAAIRDREGYMCELKKDAKGYLLIENHCPVCAAATECQGFCRAELKTFQKVLGKNAAIAREEHIVSGARRCAYRIIERTPRQKEKE
jgi:predicted ArsR family transcriptional regulator